MGSADVIGWCSRIGVWIRRCFQGFKAFTEYGVGGSAFLVSRLWVSLPAVSDQYPVLGVAVLGRKGRWFYWGLGFSGVICLLGLPC